MPTTSSLTGVVAPFVPLTLVSPYRGFGAYAVDGTTSPLTFDYTQQAGGVPTAAGWSAVIATFGLGA